MRLLYAVKNFALGLVLAAGLSACAGTETAHGNFITPRQISALAPGQTQDEVLFIMGSPSTVGTMNTQRWVYYTEQQRSQAFEPNQLLERTVLVLDFDAEGRLQTIEKRTAADAQTVAMSPTTTPTQGQALGVIDQLLENVSAFGR